MNQSNIDAIYNLLDSIKVTKDNKKLIEETRKNMENGQYAEALEKLKLLNSKRKEEEAKPKKRRGRKHAHKNSSDLEYRSWHPADCGRHLLFVQ